MESQPFEQSGSNANLRWLWVTVPAAAEAEAIAEELLNLRLAACVNILPGLTSYYRWKGQICRDAEVAMVIKTAASALDRCQQRLCEMHSAELPCILTFEPREGYLPFMDWVQQQVNPLSEGEGEG